MPLYFFRYLTAVRHVLLVKVIDEFNQCVVMANARLYAPSFQCKHCNPLTEVISIRKKLLYMYSALCFVVCCRVMTGFIHTHQQDATDLDPADLHM